MKKDVVIIGGGPAGLTAAYEFLTKSPDNYNVTVLEASNMLGGISKTVSYNGNRMDMGGHRFFSKVPEVNAWWESMLPTQGSLPKDDKLLERTSNTVPNGPDPEKTDLVMLRRNRVSRIYFNTKFFDYPISFKLDTILNMGLGNTFIAGMSYIKSSIFKREENSLEDFFINRFGSKLYHMFFENYTENLWGRHPSQISADWGAQRVKGLSISSILKDMFSKLFHIKQSKVETSLIEEFSYPKLGPGQLWEVVGSKVFQLGGTILFNCEAINFTQSEDKITGVTYIHDTKETTISCDYLLSSMPLKDLVAGLPNVPNNCITIANGLPYRDFMTLGVLVSSLNLINKTKIRTINNIIPDNWVYVHDKGIKMGRFQVFNNWSPYMVSDPTNTVWLGLEYFCNEGDTLWSMDEHEFSSFAISEMLKMGLISDKSQVLDTHMEKVKKAYPAYFDTYSEIDTLITYLNTIQNLYCIGRNGQHRYNNLDHSMCTSFEAVNNILTNKLDKSNIWGVNTEKEYHESNN